MNQLSRCLFMWDASDLEALKEAKLQELQAKDVFPPPPKTDILRHVSKHELVLHCRSTRGAEETVALIKKLLDCFKEAKDTLGIPLLKAVPLQWYGKSSNTMCLAAKTLLECNCTSGLATRRRARGFCLHTDVPEYSCSSIQKPWMLIGPSQASIWVASRWVYRMHPTSSGECLMTSMDSSSLPRCTGMRKESLCSESSWSCRCTFTHRQFQLRLNQHFPTCLPSSQHQLFSRGLLVSWRWRWSAQMPTVLPHLVVTCLRVALATSLGRYADCSITTVSSQLETGL